MKALVLTVLAVFSPVLNAKSLNNFRYFGFSLLQHSYEDVNFIPDIDEAELEPYTLDVDDRDLGWRFLIGQHFNRFVAVEAGVSYFGKAEFALLGEVTDEEDNVSTEVLHNGESSTLAGDIRLVGTLPLNKNFFLKAFAGTVFFNNERTFLASAGSEGVWMLEEEADTGNANIVGFGAAYGFSERFAMTLEYEETEIADVTTNALSLSLLFSIGK